MTKAKLGAHSSTRTDDREVPPGPMTWASYIRAEAEQAAAHPEGLTREWLDWIAERTAT